MKHVDYNGAKLANVHFHTETYAVQVNPALKNVSFPNEAPRGIPLRSAKPPVKSEPPSEASGSTAPKSPSSKKPPAFDAVNPTYSMEGMETLSDEELQQAIESRKATASKTSVGAVVLRDDLIMPAEEWWARMAVTRAKLRRSLGLPPEDEDPDDILY